MATSISVTGEKNLPIYISTHQSYTLHQRCEGQSPQAGGPCGPKGLHLVGRVPQQAELLSGKWEE